MMKQALLYGLKVWITAIGIAYASMLLVIFYRLSQPGHPKELDPFYGTILFVVGNIFFLPAWAAFCFCSRSITKLLKVNWKQKAVLNAIAWILLILTFSPLFISYASDETYYPIAGFYLAAISIGTWLYRPVPLSKVDNELNIAN
jgi:hypothetical protein